MEHDPIQEHISHEEEILQAIGRAPREPGCYLWKDAHGTILYIGKANDLRARLKSYLRPDTIKTEFLMRNVRSLDWITTGNETEALILEANLIKKNKPRFNVRLKDDKRYPYICVSTSEEYPRIFITRTIRNDQNHYFGPYTDAKSARAIIDFIHRAFPIRKKNIKIDRGKPRKPCMNFHIHRCPGPCQGNVDPADYNKIVNEIILFLEGKREVLEDLVLKRIQDYSEKLDFEKAAVYRDLLLQIRKVTEEQSVMSPGGGDEDIIAMAKDETGGQIVLMEVRNGRILERKSFPLQGLEKSQDPEIITGFLRDYYIQTSYIPSKIVIPLRVGQKEIRPLEDYFSWKTGRRVSITAAASREVKAMQQLAVKNAELQLKERILATKFRDERRAMIDLQKMLNLKELPAVLECYDISHLSGSNTVASGIRFVDGKPDRSGYRKYKIRNVEGINDPASMHETIQRRIERLQKENRPFPDLIVIDGGIPQLNAAKKAADKLGANIPMIGLAKQREEIYFPGDPYPKKFDENSPGMRLIRRARDEAHRFGVTFQRKLRNKSMVRHALDSVTDIGPARRLAILKHFAGRQMETVSESELQEVPGVGKTLASKIYRQLHSDDSDKGRIDESPQ